MLEKTRAIVLHNLKYRETGIILYCYSENYGRITFIANGVRKNKTRFPASYFQPLTLIEVIFYNKQSRNLYRMKEISSSLIYNTMHVNIIKSCIAMFIAEVLYRTLHEEESNASLFGFLEKSFCDLDSRDEGIANFHLHFMLHFSGFLGIFPAGLLTGRRKDADNKDIISFDELDERAFEAVLKMLKDSGCDLQEIRINNKERNEILDCIIKHYNFHLEGVLKLKSLPVLREVLN